MKIYPILGSVKAGLFTQFADSSLFHKNEILKGGGVYSSVYLLSDNIPTS